MAITKFRESASMLHVLSYHKTKDSKNFEIHLKYLVNNYNIIGYQDLTQNLFENKKLPENPLLLTFDDGDVSNYEVAYPLLKKYNKTAIFFIITDLINTKKPFWWDEIEYYLGKIEGNKKVWEVKKWPNVEREKFVNRLREASTKEPMSYRQLQNFELINMIESGFTIANHSHTHPMFDQCSPDELLDEISKSIDFLNNLKMTSNVFAYPNGNYSHNSEKILKNNDTDVAFLFDHKINRGNINPLRISRLVVNDTTPLWKLKLILSGLHGHILPITKFFARVKSKLKK